MKSTPYELFALLLTLALPSFSAAQQSPTAAAAENPGKSLYQAFCFLCHGGRGEGGELGPSITSTKVMAATDRDLYSSIANGFVDKGMPMFGRSLTRAEIDALVVYVRELQQRDSSRSASRAQPSPIPAGGDVIKGEALFKGKAGCFDCHSTFFAGGTIGPDLTKVAERLNQNAIYEAVATPSKRITRDYAAKTITMKSGKTIEGIFRNETPETIQILGKDGALWTTYFKKDLASIETRKESLMPAGVLEKLSPEETKDLFAYLYALK